MLLQSVIIQVLAVFIYYLAVFMMIKGGLLVILDIQYKDRTPCMI